MSTKIKSILLLVSIILLIIATGVSFFFSPKKEKEVVKPEKTSLLTLSYTMESPGGIEWKIENTEGQNEIPEVVVRLELNEEKINNFFKLVGFKAEEKKDIGEITIWTGNREKEQVILNKKVGALTFSREIEETGKTGGGRLHQGYTGQVREKFKELITTLSNEEKKTKLEIGEMAYKELVPPRWVDSNEENGEAMEIRADYYFNKLPVIMMGDSAVRAVFGNDGKLIKLEAQLISIEEVGGVLKTEELEQIKKRRIEEFIIVRVSGDREFDLRGKDELISKTRVTGKEVGYLYDQVDKKAYPYYLFWGNSNLTTGTVRIILGTGIKK